jgi:hypothetical protein
MLYVVQWFSCDLSRLEKQANNTTTRALKLGQGRSQPAPNIVMWYAIRRSQMTGHHLIELTPVNSGTKSNPHNPPSSPTSEGKGNGGAIREAGRWELAVISHIYATIIGPTASLALQRSDRPLSGLGCTAWHLSSFAMIFPRLSEFSLDYLPELRFAVSPIYIDKGWSYMCVA